MAGKNAAARREDISGTKRMTDGGLETGKTDRTSRHKSENKHVELGIPGQKKKLVTEVNSASELMTILALLSIVSLDVYDTKSKGKYVLKLTHNSLNYFDS